MRHLKLIASLALLMSCQTSHRLPSLEPEFWRQDGETIAQQAISKGDSGLIVLVLPDSTWLAFTQPMNLEMNTARDIYHIHYGDFGIDSLGLERYRDSINVFLQAYNFRKIALALE